MDLRKSFKSTSQHRHQSSENHLSWVLDMLRWGSDKQTFRCCWAQNWELDSTPRFLLINLLFLRLNLVVIRCPCRVKCSYCSLRRLPRHLSITLCSGVLAKCNTTLRPLSTWAGVSYSWDRWVVGSRFGILNLLQKSNRCSFLCNLAPCPVLYRFQFHSNLCTLLYLPLPLAAALFWSNSQAKAATTSTIQLHSATLSATDPPGSPKVL